METASSDDFQGSPWMEHELISTMAPFIVTALREDVGLSWSTEPDDLVTQGRLLRDGHEDN